LLTSSEFKLKNVLKGVIPREEAPGHLKKNPPGLKAWKKLQKRKEWFHAARNN